MLFIGIYPDCKNNMKLDFWNPILRNRHYLLPMHRTCCNKGNFSNLPTKNLQKGCWYHLPTEHNKQTTEHTFKVSNNLPACLMQEKDLPLTQQTHKTAWNITLSKNKEQLRIVHKRNTTDQHEWQEFPVRLTWVWEPHRRYYQSHSLLIFGCRRQRISINTCSNIVLD